MSEKVLNTRISLKYDTYENWTTKNPVLKAGEVAIATVPSNTGDIQNAPSVIMKVGDGTSNYNSLKFVSGLAADVYEWAKAATKPTYSASEITGLSDYISGEIQDTDTQYKIVKVDNYNYKLQSKTLDGTWTDVTDGTITIPQTDLSNYPTKEEAKGYADAKDTAIAAAKSAADAAQADVDALETKVTTLIGDDTGKSARSIAAEETAKIVAGADESYDTLKEIADWISSHATDAASMNSQINTNKDNITMLTSNINALTADVNGLATIASTVNVNDLIQTSGDTLVLDCGNATL